MRGLTFVLAMLTTTSAFAKDLTITLTDKEQQALLSLVDAGIKSLGIQSIPTAVMVINKLREANGPAAPTASPSPQPTPAPKKD